MGSPASRMLRALPALLALATAIAPAQGQTLTLAAHDLSLASEPARVDVVQWRGHPALLALYRAKGRPDPVTGSGQQLALISLGPRGLFFENTWSVPGEMRWVTPIRVREAGQRLLALIGGGWYLGHPAGPNLRWERLCACDSVFTGGKERLPSGVQFAVDLDGDGFPEVLLPTWNGLVVHRLGAGGRDLVPLWRNHWVIRERYEVKRGVRVNLKLPHFQIRDFDGDGTSDLIQIHDTHLRVTRHPNPFPEPGGTHFFLDGSKHTRLRNAGLPAPLNQALAKIGEAGYQAETALLADLERHRPPDTRAADWEPHLRRVVEAARETIPTYLSHTAGFPDLGGKGRGENLQVLAVADMDGDGTVDALHAKSIDESDTFNQKNQLRWYAGRVIDKRLRFEPKPQLFFTEGPAFAQLVYTRTDSNRRPGLFVATTEVNLMAIIRAFTVNEVTLNVFAYSWKGNRIAEPADSQGELDFKVDPNSRKRPMLILADLDGDGWRDYLFNLVPGRLVAFGAQGGRPRFGQTPLVTAETPLPRKREWVLVSDLDGDGREEVVLWYQDKETPPERRAALRVLRLEPAPPPK